MDRDYDIVVAGGGIAGLSAGLAAARLGRKTLVLTGDVLGGHLLSIETVEAYPGFPEGVPGYDLCPMVHEAAAAAGASFASAEVEKLEPGDGAWQVTTSEGACAARAAIIATGTRLRELGVPGEARLRGKGVSHCASCDAPLLRGKVAVVVGGGDSAMQESLTLAGSCARVVMVHRGAALGGQASFRERIEAHERIEVRYSTVLEEILGADGVTGVRQRNGAGAVSELEAAGVFVYVGLEPNTDFLAGRLKLDKTGRILTDTSMRAGMPGLFAAGTVRSASPGRAAAAAGDGTAAAIAADEFLAGGAAQATASLAGAATGGTHG
jgi:thioredoxin reductase (NADPH)